MALTTTTLSSAAGLNDKNIVVASATGFLAGYKVKVGGEWMEVTKDYVSGTTIPVLRGRNGSEQVAHVATENVTVGEGSDFASVAAGAMNTEAASVRPVILRSISATSTLTLPPAGCDMRVMLNGTAAITLTVPVPTQDLDMCKLTLVSNGVAQHVYTFTGGFGGVGSGYTTVTGASAARCSIEVIAANGRWNAISAPGWSSTVTKVTGAIG